MSLLKNSLKISKENFAVVYQRLLFSLRNYKNAIEITVSLRSFSSANFPFSALLFGYRKKES